MEKEYKHLVSTRCFTYNHAPFIEETLQGFAIQETSFPAVFCIVDDASTDGEPEVLRKWAEDNLENVDNRLWRNMPYGQLAIASKKGNPNLTFVLLLLNSNHNNKEKKELKLQYISEWNDDVKYQAICEGDDYWIDPLKLQKQVDFMEDNPDFGLIHTDFDCVDEKRNHSREQPDILIFPDILKRQYFIGTLTVLYRNSVFKACPKHYIGKNWPMGDWPKWIEISHDSKVKFLKEVTAKYRILPLSASHSPNVEKSIAFVKAGYDIKKYYAEIYGVESIDIYNESYYETLVRVAARLNSYETAKLYFELAKKEKRVSFRCRMFYLAAKYALVKRIINMYREI